MNIELNGVVYTKDEIQSHVNKYISYLEGLSTGLYAAEEGEVALLELAENKSIEDVINKLQNFQTAENIESFDFNGSGVSDANDIDLLKSIVAKDAESSELQINDKGSTKEFITSGGYKIVTNSNAQDVKFYYPDGSLMTHIHGDPHVDEYNESGQKTGGWHYADDSTFILPDGTEVVMNSTRWGGNENIMVNRGIYVKDGDKVAAFGLEFGEGRNNAASDAEEGATLGLRFLEVDASEWDAVVADTNDSGKRNGVYAHVNGQWARRAEDGNFYDLNSEAWGAYVARQGNELFTNGEALDVNRDQLIAALDGQDVLTYQAILDLDLGDFETDIVNQFLQNKSKFTESLVQQLGLLNDFGVEKEDLIALIDGGVTRRQGEFLSKVTDFFAEQGFDKEVNSSVKDSIIDQYFSYNNRVDRESRSNNPELSSLVLELIDLDVRENNPFADYTNQIFENSLFAEGEIDIDKVKSQAFFLSSTNGKRAFLRDNQDVNTALNNLLASKFFDVEAELVNAANEILGDNEETFIELLKQSFVAASNTDHTYIDQHEELLEKLLDPNLAKIIHENDFSNGSSTTTSGSTTAVTSSRYTGSNNRTGNLLKIVDQYINTPEGSFAEFAEKVSLILGLKTEVVDDTVTQEANEVIIESIANMKLEGLRSEQAALEAELLALSGSNSRYDNRRRQNINRNLRRLSSNIASIISALGA